MHMYRDYLKPYLGSSVLIVGLRVGKVFELVGEEDAAVLRIGSPLRSNVEVMAGISKRDSRAQDYLRTYSL